MGERKSKEYLNKLQKKYNVNTLWSWSRYNSYKNDPYGYMLHYIKHEPETKLNIYGISGGICHDILESYYIEKIKYEDMINLYEDKLAEMNIAELKYNRNDETKNKAIANKYEDNMKLFFQQYIPIQAKVKTEQFIVIKVGKYVFQGYIDFVYKDKEGYYIITDFKTSTIYTGQKVEHERGQLVLYAESLVQLGVPLEKIKICWNFLKYCTIEQQLKGIDKETKLHNTKTTNALRNAWVKAIEGNIRMWLKTMEYDELEIEDLVQTCIENNDLHVLPQEIQDRYKKSDCYVYIPLDQEIINELKEDIENTLDEIIVKTEEYKKTKDDKLFWTEIDKTKEYYFYCLCGYSRQQHKPFDEYLKDIELFTKDIYSYDNKSDKSKANKDIDMSWLDEL